MKKKLELLIIFLLISLCFTMIVFCKHIELKLVNKSFDYRFNNLFEYAYQNELEDLKEVKFEQIHYEMIKELKKENIVYNEEKTSYKLVANKISKNKVEYKLVETNCDMNSLIKFFDTYDLDVNDRNASKRDEDKVENNINCKNILGFSKKQNSKFDINREVFNFNDKIGLYVDSSNDLKEIEIYDKTHILKNEFNDFSEIITKYGKGTLFLIDEGRYDYYALVYKLDNIMIRFVSFYRDGRNNLCILSKYK